MRVTRFLMVLAAVIAMGAGAMIGQDKGGKGGGKGKGGFTLPPMIKMTITGFADGGMIPAANTCAAGQGVPSPAISWTPGPAGTQSYALILHDPDPVLAGSATNDVLHWAIFDIPGNATSLPAGVPNQAELADGAKQPNNIAGQPGYFGPCPPAGHGDHHYTFEIFALSAKLGLPANTSRADLMNAMNGKVLSKGLYIGMFGQK
jgi:Raf kinase inhibitor-like YbhB/YbcL family protein